MWNQTVAAVLFAGSCILKISSALFAQTIQRAVAEQTIKVFKVNTLMTGIILASCVCEKGMVILSHVLTPRN